MLIEFNLELKDGNSDIIRTNSMFHNLTSKSLSKDFILKILEKTSSKHILRVFNGYTHTTIRGVSVGIGSIHFTMHHSLVT